MSIPGAFATALAAVLLLSSCAPSSTPSAEHTAQPSPTLSQPAFLSVDQLDEDRLPDGVAARMQVEPDSTRYQGVWDHRDIYLARKSDDSVCLLSNPVEDPDTWRAGCGSGDGVVTVQFSDGGVVKYLPMTTSAAPVGWTRLSNYVFAM